MNGSNAVFQNARRHGFENDPASAQTCRVEQQILVLYRREDDDRRRLRGIEPLQQCQPAFTREHQIEH